MVLVLAITLSIPIKANAQTIDVPQGVRNSCEKWGSEYGICPELLEAVAFKESSFRANVSNGSCKGMCQINEKLFSERMEYLGITDIYNADQNIHLCADILYDYFTEDDDMYRALAMFNYGSNKGETVYNEQIFTSYATAIVNLTEQLERASGK